MRAPAIVLALPSRSAPLALAIVLGLLSLACAPEIDDSTPEGALAMFLDALERGERENAFALIDGESQRRLAERARSATALGARELEPWEMLVEDRSALRFPRRRGGGMRTNLGSDPARAIVTVIGELPGQRAEVVMVRERGRWRILLPIPPLRGGGLDPGSP